jgi:transcriptional regulator with XRE-family HTH domain
MTKTTYSERLTQAMHAAGLTQGALAKAVGMSQSSIWKLTSGAASGSRRTVEIAKVLGVRPDWLASGELPEREVDDPEKRGAHYQALPDDTYRVDVLDIQASAGLVHLCRLNL